MDGSQRNLVGISKVHLVCPVCSSLVSKYLSSKKYSTVKDIVEGRKLISILPDATLGDALKIMSENDIRRLPVVRGDGIITDRDLRLAANSPFLKHSATEEFHELSKHKVKDVMHTSVITVNETDPIVDAAKLMRVRKVDGLPVLNSSGIVIGVITRTDLLDHLVRLLEPLNDTML